MAVDVYSDIPSLVVSPRISFSYDLNQEDVVPVEFHHHRSDDALLLESTIDFDFCVSKSFIQELSSADELFANGRILPVEIKKADLASPTTEQTHRRGPILIPPDKANTEAATSPTSENANEDPKKKRLKEILSSNVDAEEEEKPPSKPFWQFRRSSSDNGRAKSLIRSLQFLSRSNSTGSAPNPKQPTIPKVNHKPHLHKQSSVSSIKSSSPSHDAPFLYNATKRPQHKKKFRSNSNGVRISPVLNIPFPPTYISKGTVGLFGLAASLFCNGKSKKTKK